MGLGDKDKEKGVKERRAATKNQIRAKLKGAEEVTEATPKQIKDYLEEVSSN